MNPLTDELLEERLRDFYRLETDVTFTFHPEQKRALTPLFLQNRMVITAAGVMLATALGIAAFLFFRPDHTPLTTVMIPTESAAVSSRAAEETTLSSEAITDVSESALPVTASPSDSLTQDVPADHRKIAQKTEKPSLYNLEPTEQEATQPEIIIEPPSETEAATEPIVPQTDGPEIAGNGIYCEAQFEIDRLFGCEAVYCQLYDEENRPVGDIDIYSEEHSAYLSVLPDHTVYVLYNLLDLRERGVDVKPGRYHYRFYTESGDAYHGIIDFNPE